MYNSLFWSISPQDAVTQGGFLVDIVDDDTLDKAVTVAHSGVISGQAPIPIPKGCKVWHGPIDKPREIVGI